MPKTTLFDKKNDPDFSGSKKNKTHPTEEWIEEQKSLANEERKKREDFFSVKQILVRCPKYKHNQLADISSKLHLPINSIILSLMDNYINEHYDLVEEENKL